MGIFGNLFSSKKKALSSDLSVAPSVNPGYIGEAEQVANVVAAGLEQENYSAMNQQLASLIPVDSERNTYVFEHPSIGVNAVGILISVLFSLLYIYFIFIGIGTVVLSDLFVLGMTGIIGSAVLLAFNLLLIAKLISAFKFRARYENYIELLRFRNFEIVEDLALYANQPVAVVTKDLIRGVKQKLIPQGHFSREDMVFMVSNEIYDKYQEKQAAYDRYFRKYVEERARMKGRTNEMNHIMETGRKYIEKLHDSASLIKDKAVSRKVGQMETIVSMIFHEVDVNPAQAHSLGMFLNYYLPTTEKLLEAYISIGEKKVTGKSLAQTKKEIEQSLETIIRAYENILEKMYAEHEMDISSDIAAMEIMMKQDGLTE